MGLSIYNFLNLFIYTIQKAFILFSNDFLIKKAQRQNSSEAFEVGPDGLEPPTR